MNRLFDEGTLDDWLDIRWRQVEARVDGASEHELLNRDIDAWVDELCKEFRVDAPVLGNAEIEDRGETRVDVTNDFSRGIFTDEGRVSVPGYAVRIIVPIEFGETEVLRRRPNEWTTTKPMADIRAGALVRDIEIPADRAGVDLSQEAESLVRETQRWLDFARAQLEGFNEKLAPRIRAAIEARRERAIGRHDLLARSGLPLRTRADAPRTYQAPGIARKPAPPRATPTSPAGGLAPVMVEEFYEHVLALIRAGARGIERARQSFAGLDEEDLRHLFLFVLNTHYEGAATGEAFNAEGKTDILVRVANRNVFIGECKFWKGQKAFCEALDQVFGYTTWHDTKVALIVFVRSRDLTAVIEKAREALEAHPEFRRWGVAPDGELRCQMTWPGDPSRSAELSVVFVHLALDNGLADGAAGEDGSA